MATKAYPFFVLNLTIPCGKIDLNVTPDKRTILINGDKVVFALVKSSVINVYGADSVYLNRSEYSKSSSQTTVIFENERTLQEPTPSSQETPTSSQNQSFITNYLAPLPKRAISHEQWRFKYCSKERFLFVNISRDYFATSLRLKEYTARTIKKKK